MKLTALELHAALQSRGLVDAELDTSDAAPPPDRPLAIGLLLGVSGWVAGIFMLLFVALLFRPDSAAAAAFSGLVLLAAAWGLFKVDGDGAQVFVAQLALALSIAGQCLMLYAMSEHTHGIAPIASAALVLQTVIALLMPNRLQRTLSTFFAAIAWALTVRFALVGEPESWRASVERPGVSVPVALVGWVTTWAPFVAALWWLIRSEPLWMARAWQPVLRPIVTGLIIGLAFATLASHPFESFRWFGSGEADAGGLALWPLLSAAGALAATAAAFALRQRGLMALCVVATIAQLSHFYYVLGTSLLVKSILMLAMGGALLLAERLLADKEPA